MARRNAHRTVVLAMVSMVVLLPAGCRKSTSPSPEPPPGQKIRSIQIEGADAISEDDLVQYLLLRKGDRVVDGADEAAFQVLIDVYHAAGYYEAKITDVQVETDKKDRLHITIFVEEGTPTLVEKVGFHWKRTIDDSEQLEADVPLKADEVADIAKLNESREQLIKDLWGRGRALAEVNESMVINRSERTAVVTFEIDPGPVCVVGSIAVQGLHQVPSEPVQRELEDFHGVLYTAEIRDEIEKNLLRLNVFSYVSVLYGDRLNSEGMLDLTVIVSEADFRGYKAGVAAQLENNKSTLAATATYYNNNLLGRLTGFRVRGLFGWTVIPALWDPEDSGPVSLLEPSFTKKGWLNKELLWSLAARVETDVEEDYKYFSPSFRPSVSRVFAKRLFLKLGYNFEYFIYFGITEQLLIELDRIYGQFESPVRRSEWEVSLRLAMTDRLVDPGNGLLLKFSYWIASEAIGSQVSYNKFQPSLTAYWQFLSWAQFVARTEVGVILPFEDTTYPGIQTSFFLGGYNTVRGWGGDRLAPWEIICVDVDDCEDIRLGGNTMVLGNLELRFKLAKIYRVVTFLDVGDVQPDALTFKPGLWNYTVGTGIRVNTPVGKFRLDFGYRVNDPELYTSEPRFAFHLGLGEAL